MVFDEERKSSAKLFRAARRCSPDKAALLEAMAVKLAGIDRLLAQIGIAEAESTPVQHPSHESQVSHKIQQAHDMTAVGDARCENGKYTRAIHDYRKAWKYAAQAINIANQPSGDDENDDDDEDDDDEDDDDDDDDDDD
jgi:methylphosphotriester-DNA--protein-cysteine methyltransferase